VLENQLKQAEELKQNQKQTEQSISTPQKVKQTNKHELK